MNPIRPGLRLINRSRSVAKVELHVEPGEEVEVPNGALLNADRSALRPIDAGKPARKQRRAASLVADSATEAEAGNEDSPEA